MKSPNRIVYVYEDNPLLQEVLVASGKFITDYLRNIFVTTACDAVFYGYPVENCDAMINDAEYYYRQMDLKRLQSNTSI